MGKNKNKKSKLAKQHQKQTERNERHKERMVKRKLKKKRDKEEERKYLEDMKRFREELIQYGLRILEVGGDGNCLFRSVADQLEGSQVSYKQYRADAIQYMVLNRDDFEPFIEDDIPFDEYIDTMSQDGEWGGNLEIQALAMRFQFNVIVHQLDAPVFAMANFDPNSVRTIHLSYHMGEHYNSVRLLNDHSTNEPPEEIPMNLTKDPSRLDEYNEQKDKKLKDNAKKFKNKSKEEIKQESTEEEFKGDELTSDDDLMDVSKDSRIIQYACTVTGLPEYHIMKQSLETIFGVDSKISFENVETMRKVIEEDYTNKEVGILTDDFDGIEICKTISEEEKMPKKASGPSADEITENIKAGRIFTEGNKWITPPNRNKKCYCESKMRYKLCCLPKDKKRLDELLNGKDYGKELVKDAQVKDFLASLVCI